MGRFSPTVQVEPFTGLGDALTAGLNAHLLRKQQEYQKDMTASQTGFGLVLPKPDVTQSPPVSIMGTSASTGPTTSQPSAPLPGVGGLPSPGRVQGMTQPTAPAADLSEALRSGQQGVLGGATAAPPQAGQPHDDLRAAFSSLGDRVMGNGNSGTMTLPGQSYQPPPQTSGFDPNAMATLPSGRQVPLSQTQYGQSMVKQQVENMIRTITAGKDSADTDLARARAFALMNPKDHYVSVSNMFDTNGNPIGGTLDTTTGDVTPTGFSGKPVSPTIGSKEWTDAEIAKAKIGAQYGYHAPVEAYTPTTVTDPKTGQVHVGTLNKLTGRVTDTGVEGKQPAAGGGAAGQKAKTYVDLMQGAYPTMEKLAGKIRPDVVAAAVLHPNAGNLALNQDEQDYLASARSFLAGVLHQESGARLSHEQLQFGMLRYLPNVGDTPQTIQNKLASARQVIQERAQALGGAGPSGGSGATGGMFDDLVPKK